MPTQKDVLESLLEAQAGFPVEILCPQRGKKREIIDLLLKNIQLVHEKGSDPVLSDLKEILSLPKIPDVIECFDISNHGEEFAVGSMSRFVGGKPDKSGYRKFKIKTVTGRDDFAMIGEIIKRRYLNLLENDSQLPDLVLIDGGKGQLGYALSSLKSLGLKIPCVSIAKENEEIFVPGKKLPIISAKKHSALKVLQHARDESHRFGVTYNRTIRKNMIK